MCAPSQGAILPYGLKIPSPYFPFGTTGGLTQAHLSALDFQRSQLNDYNVRVQFGLRNYQNSLGLSPFHAYITDPYAQAYFYKHDPRARFVQEEPKPSHSYIGLIGMAILNSKEKKLVLSDIYQWILDNYPYFRTRGPGWRNSIRHNLSLNDCFIKAGRSANGKGHYWAVHPANVEDFERGDFRRRRAQRKVRRHMGLSVPDDDDSPTPSPTQPWPHHDITHETDRGHLDPMASPGDHSMRTLPTRPEPDHLVLSHPNPAFGPLPVHPRKPSKKRQFDMASLLAPDDDEEEELKVEQQANGNKLHCQQLHASGFAFHPIQDLRSQESTGGKSSGENCHSGESSGSNSTQELIVDVHSTSSGSGKERMSCDSDDYRDNDNDEIQVTSGENSPAQDLAESDYCDTGHNGQEENGKYVSDNERHSGSEGKLSMGSHCSESSQTSASPTDSESKTENALDLSSPALPNGEKKIDINTRKGEGDNRIFFNKVNGQRPASRDLDGIRHSQNTGLNGNMFKHEGEALNGVMGHSDLKSANVMPKTNGCGQNSDAVNVKSPYRDDTVNGMGDPRADPPMSVPNSGGDLVRRNVDRFQYFRSEVQDLRRPLTQCNAESNSLSKDSSQSEAERQMDARAGQRTENPPSSSAMDTSRALSEHLRWAEMSKHPLQNDRMSAFSTLGVRSHSMYPPFHMRTFPVSHQRLLPSGTLLRPGAMPTSMMYGSTPSQSSSVTVMKGMDGSADTTKCSSSSNNNSNSGSSINSNIHNSNNNNNNNNINTIRANINSSRD